MKPIAWLAVALALVAATASARSVREGVYSAPQAERGRAAYEVNCAKCHGDALRGDGLEVPPLGGKAFVVRWTDGNLGEIFSFISANMPFDKPGKLDAQTYADLIAYILQFNGYAPGATALEPALAALTDIKIEPPPP